MCPLCGVQRLMEDRPLLFFFLFVLFSLPYLSHSDALVGPLRLESCFCHG